MSNPPSSLPPPPMGAQAGLGDPMFSAPGTDAASQPRSKWPRGMIAAPNINLYNRPTVHNPDGSVSTVHSFSRQEERPGHPYYGREVLVPTVSDDGRMMSEAEAWDQYQKTGMHLGVFGDAGVQPAWQHANSYASALHDDYAAGQYGGGQKAIPQNVGIQTTPFNTTIPKTLPPPPSISK